MDALAAVAAMQSWAENLDRIRQEDAQRQDRIVSLLEDILAELRKRE